MLEPTHPPTPMLEAAAPPTRAVPRGLVPTPFWPRLQAASLTQDWMGWAGHLSPAILTTMESEYFTLRSQASLFDISPMHKYRITGPDAERMLNRLVTRDIRKLQPGRVAYALWCDETGATIDDGTIFRFGPQDFRLCCQEPQRLWLDEVAWGLQIHLEDESDAIAGLSLQGPTSWSVLAAAGLGEATARLKPFDLVQPEPGLMISRTGFTGDLGYELWPGAETALPLWDRLMQAGRIWGLKPVGYRAVDLARLEAGFILAGTDYISSHHAIRPSRGRTPYELGFGRLVDLDKPQFNGRRALLRHHQRGPQHLLVGLDIAGNKDPAGALVYHRGRREVGFITTGAWSPTAKRCIALAELQAAYAGRTNLAVEIYARKEGKYDRIMAPAVVTPRPFLSLPRARATPPLPF